MSSNQSISDSSQHDPVQAQLLDARDGWKRRLAAIQTSRRRESVPLDPDFEEQAIQRENDEALDALDERGREELQAIEAALARLESGTFGICVGCGDEIPAKRLSALPTAATCISCADSRRSA